MTTPQHSVTGQSGDVGLHVKPQQVRLDSLTAMRFFAAALVLAVHSFRPILDISALNILSDVGVVGVSFFFVLSGFVLTWSARPGDRPAAFYRRRWARVYPLHVVTTLIALCTLSIGDAFATWYTAIAALLLIHAWVPAHDWYFAANGPSWSLSCETLFYATFPTLARRLDNLRPGQLARLATAVVTYLALVPAVLLIVGNSELLHAITYINPVYRIGEFILGIIAALAMRHPIPTMTVPQATVLAAASYLAVTAAHAGLIHFAGQPIPHAYQALLMLPAWLALITAGARADSVGAPSFYRRPSLVRLGEWSFALYLIHTPVRSVLLWLWQPPFTTAQAIAAELVFLAASIALAGALHVGIERPLERRLRGRRR